MSSTHSNAYQLRDIKLQHSQNLLGASTSTSFARRLCSPVVRLQLFPDEFEVTETVAIIAIKQHNCSNMNDSMKLNLFANEWEQIRGVK